jgi:hypothetical protein
MALLVILGVVTLSGAASAQSVDINAIRKTKRVSAVRTSQPIRVDGVLDEQAWQLTEPARDFYQQQPDEFGAAVHRTEVRFLYDDENLYVGAVLHDEAPDRLITNDLKRDFGGRDSDSFGLILDTFRDERNSYGFLTNPGAAMRDTLAYDNGRRNDPSWHGVWVARTSIRPDGWSLELAIAFKTLRFPDGPTQEWGLNLLRTVRYDNEITTWSPVPRQFSHYNVAYAGRLTGIDSVARGRNLQVKPFATAEIGQDRRGEAGWNGQADGGLDLKWGITSSLLLDGSYRTDFSQVEADEQQINLTRFSAFYPEKREFFLENPASFQIGIVEPDAEEPRRDLVPFFSRRIGLSSSGQPIPVIGGLRLTGRAGRQSIGLLTVQTEPDGERPGDNFSAARIGRDLSDSVSLGGFYFGREATGSADFNRVAGADLRAMPSRILQIEAFGMHSSTAGAAGDWAGRAGLRLDANRHRARLGLVHIGEAFRHDLGFVRRRGIGTLFGKYARVFHPADTRSSVREFSVGTEFEATGDDRYSQLLTGVMSLRHQILFADGGDFRAWAEGTFEHLDRPFNIGGSDLQVAPGDYRFGEVGASYASNKSARLSGSIEATVGEFWDGHQRSVKGGLRVRLNSHVAASGTFGRSAIRLPQGPYTADLLGMRLDWSFTPRMFLNAFVQYNGETDTWLSNVRYNVIHRPLSDIYVVWNETRLPGMTERVLMLKYTHMLSF